VFQQVADQTNCVIASRAISTAATGLLEEGYATKGFHNKAKSCPWGPMAGFVMADPRFTKNPDIEGQRKDLKKAVTAGATEIPLYLTERRRLELEWPRPAGLGLMTRVGGNINEHIYEATPPAGGGPVPPGIKAQFQQGSMRFVLRRAITDSIDTEGKQLWQVLYAAGEVRLSNNLTSPNSAAGNQLLPVIAMVDEACPAAVRRTYRAATTADYDLFAVFPPRRGANKYNRTGQDQRMVPGSDRFAINIKTFSQAEDPHRGNMTGRVSQIRQLINAGVVTAGYRGGEVVHHSDEAGRPMVSDIDFPFIAFVPHRQPFCASSPADFKELIGVLAMRYVMTFNPGWQRQLGFTVSEGGSYVV
jgi:hypothetical protein